MYQTASFSSIEEGDIPLALRSWQTPKLGQRRRNVSVRTSVLKNNWPTMRFAALLQGPFGSNLEISNYITLLVAPAFHDSLRALPTRFSFALGRS